MRLYNLKMTLIRDVSIPLESQCTLLFRLACETSSMSTSASTSIPTTPSSSQPDEILPSPSGYESGGDSGILLMVKASYP